ncbi:MAG: DUF5682 family protein [Bacillota bacterium]
MNGGAVEQVGVHIFGVRHLSPGGAKHLLDELNHIRPTAVLIEGPSDATEEIRHLAEQATRPPVALLAFTSDLPVRTALWPFASYSPEYQAMKWANAHHAMCAFIDLPSSVMIGLEDLRRQTLKDADTPVQAEHITSSSIYDRIAALSGEDDYDMYWERNYEHNLNQGAYREAILAFSSHVRALTEEVERVSAVHEFAYNAIRESYMRRKIKEAITAGHEPERIVVICGAYHAAALADLSHSMMDEELKCLPTRATRLTLMPYSYYKLSSMSGYGAGNHAPHYFEMMWSRMQQGTLDELPYEYLSSVARQLRQKGTHRSTAEVIEAVRMAQSLSALRGGSAPVLRDLRDAAQTLLGHGDLSVVAEALSELNVGTAIGQLAEGVSQTPLQDDLNRLFKSLKLTKYKTTVATDLMLDLRENRRASSEASAYLDLNRSFLLHRLKVLDIPFAQFRSVGQEQSTWAEHWVVQWSPETEIQVVESTLLGETVEVAAAYVMQQKLDACQTIAEASQLILIACECGMVAQLENGRKNLQRLAADQQDVIQMAAAAKGLSTLIRYGDIRRMDTSLLVPLLEQLFMRSCLFLTDASHCSDTVAVDMVEAIQELNRIALDHSEQVDQELWIQELHHLAARDDLNPKCSGFACALLLERNELTREECAAEVSRRLSPGVPADLGAGWFEGLSMRNRYVLLSRMSLWEQLSEYIGALDEDEFVRALVFLRRAFSVFNSGEKTMIAELLGELWDVNTEQAAEVLTQELREDEAKMLDDLNDFDFEDF